MKHILQQLEQSVTAEILPPVLGVTSQCVWVKFEHGRILCKHFGLEQKLQPLLDHGLELQRECGSKPMEHFKNPPTKV